MNTEIMVNALGGLALFLLAMQMMTDGLKTFAGDGLKQLLARWTSTPIRGVLSGFFVTGIVQSSTAVTVAAIGFVNAGVLTLRQALGVIFGTNVGTTMTGWLVSLVGFGFRIESFALPILTVGVVTRLVASGARGRGLGEALAGFGLFFLGLAMLKDSFGGIAGMYGANVTGGALANNWAVFLAVGFVATLLTQSSSAAIAIILTAAAGGVVGIEAAAAAVIGANVGTTSTAAIAALKATPSARRLALGHVAFNLITAVVALALLPLLLRLVSLLGDWLDVEGSPAAILALFHTVFNVLGVMIMLPLAGRLATLLEKMFRTAEEDLARPQHLDATLAETPALAVSALWQELQRVRALVVEILQATLSGSVRPLEAQAAAVLALGDEISRYVGVVRTGSMSAQAGGELAGALSASRYLRESSRLVPGLYALQQQTIQLGEPRAREAVHQVLELVGDCLAQAALPAGEPVGDEERFAALERFQQGCDRARSALLHAAAAHRLPVERVNLYLDALSDTRRLVEQLQRGDRLLRNPAAAEAIEAEAEGQAAAGESPAARPPAR